MVKKFSALIVAAVLFTSCLQKNETPVETAKIGAMLGTTGEKFIKENYPGAKIQVFGDVSDAIKSLNDGNLDYVITAYTVALELVRDNKDFEILPDFSFDEGFISIAVGKENNELLEKLSLVLSNYKYDGTIESIVSNWIKPEDGEYVIADIPKKPNGKILKVGVAANREPMCFVKNGKIIGLDCELIERIAYELDMRVEYKDMQFAALIPSLESGRIDVAISNIAATEERKEKVNFTEGYFHNPQVLLRKK